MKPVAWLHCQRPDADVITDAVNHVWGGVAIGREALYTVPLYTAEQLKAAKVAVLREAADEVTSGDSATELRRMADELESSLNAGETT